MRRLVGATLVATFVLPPLALAVDKKKAAYVGGTVPGMSDKAEGTIDTSDPDSLRFTPERVEGAIDIPFKGVEQIEYGPAGAVKESMKPRWSLKPRVLNPWAKRHYLTITYKDSESRRDGLLGSHPRAAGLGSPKETAHPASSA